TPRSSAFLSACTGVTASRNIWRIFRASRVILRAISPIPRLPICAAGSIRSCPRPSGRPRHEAEKERSTMKIRRAMVMAAGKGTRMRHLTRTMPKPLVPFAGRPLIDHVLDRLEEAGIEEIIVNVHHFADALEAHLAGRKGAD